MQMPVLRRDRSRQAQIVLAVIVPFAFGALVGVMLGISAGTYWALLALATAGGVLVGFEHRDWRRSPACSSARWAGTFCALAHPTLTTPEWGECRMGCLTGRSERPVSASGRPHLSEPDIHEQRYLADRGHRTAPAASAAARRVRGLDPPS
jgi:hypothetical protein